MVTHADDIASGQRFSFGENWSRFLRVVDDEKIGQAKASLQSMLGVETLVGKSFLDIGSGSGLFSLAARLLGARVRSFDYDPQSVACTQELKRRYFDGDPDWGVERGSVLDAEHLRNLGQFDIVYSWGVLHHTGEMWQALESVVPLVKPEGTLFISIYNDQGRASVVWTTVKRAYNRTPKLLRPVILALAVVVLWGPNFLYDLVKGTPFGSWRSYHKRSRGMSPWRDLVDWVGGYPFEVAKPEQVFRFFRDRGFVLRELVTCAGGLGCNEFVFTRPF